MVGANAVRGMNEVVEGLTLVCGVGPGVSGLARLMVGGGGWRRTPGGGGGKIRPG